MYYTVVYLILYEERKAYIIESRLVTPSMLYGRTNYPESGEWEAPRGAYLTDLTLSGALSSLCMGVSPLLHNKFWCTEIE